MKQASNSTLINEGASVSQIRSSSVNPYHKKTGIPNIKQPSSRESSQHRSNRSNSRINHSNQNSKSLIIPARDRSLNYPRRMRPLLYQVPPTKPSKEPYFDNIQIKKPIIFQDLKALSKKMSNQKKAILQTENSNYSNSIDKTVNNSSTLLPQLQKRILKGAKNHNFSHMISDSQTQKSSTNEMSSSQDMLKYPNQIDNIYFEESQLNNDVETEQTDQTGQTYSHNKYNSLKQNKNGKKINKNLSNQSLQLGSPQHMNKNKSNKKFNISQIKESNYENVESMNNTKTNQFYKSNDSMSKDFKNSKSNKLNSSGNQDSNEEPSSVMSVLDSVRMKLANVKSKLIKNDLSQYKRTNFSKNMVIGKTPKLLDSFAQAGQAIKSNKREAMDSLIDVDHHYWKMVRILFDKDKIPNYNDLMMRLMKKTNLFPHQITKMFGALIEGPKSNVKWDDVIRVLEQESKVRMQLREEKMFGKKKIGIQYQSYHNLHYLEPRTFFPQYQLNKMITAKFSENQIYQITVIDSNKLCIFTENFDKMIYKEKYQRDYANDYADKLYEVNQCKMIQKREEMIQDLRMTKNIKSFKEHSKNNFKLQINYDLDISKWAGVPKLEEDEFSEALMDGRSNKGRRGKRGTITSQMSATNQSKSSYSFGGAGMPSSSHSGSKLVRGESIESNLSYTSQNEKSGMESRNQSFQGFENIDEEDEDDPDAQNSSKGGQNNENIQILQGQKQHTTGKRSSIVNHQLSILKEEDDSISQSNSQVHHPHQKTMRKPQNNNRNKNSQLSINESDEFDYGNSSQDNRTKTSNSYQKQNIQSINDKIQSKLKALNQGIQNINQQNNQNNSSGNKRQSRSISGGNQKSSHRLLGSNSMNKKKSNFMASIQEGAKQQKFVKQLNEMLKAQFKNKYADALVPISGKDKKIIAKAFKSFTSRVNPLKTIRGGLPTNYVQEPKLTKEEKMKCIQNPNEFIEVEFDEEKLRDAIKDLKSQQILKKFETISTKAENLEKKLRQVDVLKADIEAKMAGEISQLQFGTDKNKNNENSEKDEDDEYVNSGIPSMADIKAIPRIKFHIGNGPIQQQILSIEFISKENVLFMCLSTREVLAFRLSCFEGKATIDFLEETRLNEQITELKVLESQIFHQEFLCCVEKYNVLKIYLLPEVVFPKISLFEQDSMKQKPENLSFFKNSKSLCFKMKSEIIKDLKMFNSQIVICTAKDDILIIKQVASKQFQLQKSINIKQKYVSQKLMCFDYNCNNNQLLIGTNRGQVYLIDTQLGTVIYNQRIASSPIIEIKLAQCIYSVFVVTRNKKFMILDSQSMEVLVEEQLISIKNLDAQGSKKEGKDIKFEWAKITDIDKVFEEVKTEEVINAINESSMSQISKNSQDDNQVARQMIKDKKVEDKILKRVNEQISQGHIKIFAGGCQFAGYLLKEKKKLQFQETVSKYNLLSTLDKSLKTGSQADKKAYMNELIKPNSKWLYIKYNKKDDALLLINENKFMIYYSLSEDQIELSTIIDIYGEIVSVEFSHDNKKLVLGNKKGHVIIFSLAYFKVEQILKIPLTHVIEVVPVFNEQYIFGQFNLPDEAYFIFKQTSTSRFEFVIQKSENDQLLRESSDVQKIKFSAPLLTVRSNEKVVIVMLENLTITVYKSQNMKKLKIFNLLESLPRELFIREIEENMLVDTTFKSDDYMSVSTSQSMYHSDGVDKELKKMKKVTKKVIKSYYYVVNSFIRNNTLFIELDCQIILRLKFSENWISRMEVETIQLKEEDKETSLEAENQNSRKKEKFFYDVDATSKKVIMLSSLGQYQVFSEADDLFLKNKKLSFQILSQDVGESQQSKKLSALEKQLARGSTRNPIHKQQVYKSRDLSQLNLDVEEENVDIIQENKDYNLNNMGNYGNKENYINQSSQLNTQQFDSSSSSNPYQSNSRSGSQKKLTSIIRDNSNNKGGGILKNAKKNKNKKENLKDLLPNMKLTKEEDLGLYYPDEDFRQYKNIIRIKENVILLVPKVGPVKFLNNKSGFKMTELNFSEMIKEGRTREEKLAKEQKILYNLSKNLRGKGGNNKSRERISLLGIGGAYNKSGGRPTLMSINKNFDQSQNSLRSNSTSRKGDMSSERISARNKKDQKGGNKVSFQEL